MHSMLDFLTGLGYSAIENNNYRGAPMKVSEILKLKGNFLVTVTPDTPMQQAVSLMVEKDMGSLVVMDHGQLLGMLTFREVMQALQGNGSTLVDSGTVRDHMNKQPITISPDQDINEVRRLMLEEHARYVPVVRSDAVLGVMSFYDIAKAVFEAQSFENKMLKDYIGAWPGSE
jgi:CBS domain-containing protein